MDSDTWIWPRSEEQVRTDRDACRESVQEQMAEGADQFEYDFDAGAAAVFDWVLGEGPEPLWGQEAPTPEAMRRTDEGAVLAIYGRRGAPEVSSQRWAVGVQHAAMWVRGNTRRSPGSTSEDEEPLY